MGNTIQKYDYFVENKFSEESFFKRYFNKLL